MANGIYVATSGCVAELRHLEVLSNNLANARTTGFKNDRITFQEVTAQAGASAEAADKHFVAPKSGGVSLESGPLTQTDNPLDVAVTANGFLRVQTDEGVRLTKKGQLMLGRDGTLRTLTGQAVLNDRGKAIMLPPDSVPAIDEQGLISSDGVDIARLGISTVDMNAGLTKDPNGLFFPPATEAPARPEMTVLQGHVEESNVSPVRVMLDLIAVQRTFAALRQVITVSGEMDDKAARLAR